jgi:hypothetical protein
MNKLIKKLMESGLLRLVALGPQSIYLVGTPYVTVYFSAKKILNHVIQYIERNCI